MIISIYSHKDCVAINTDRINNILVRHALDTKTKFVRGVAVDFYIADYISDYKENSVMFSIDINSEDFKIHETNEILNLKKYVIDYIVTRIRKSCNDIDIVKAVTHALNQTLINREGTNDIS